MEEKINKRDSMKGNKSPIPSLESIGAIERLTENCFMARAIILHNKTKIRGFVFLSPEFVFLSLLHVRITFFEISVLG